MIYSLAIRFINIQKTAQPMAVPEPSRRLAEFHTAYAAIDHTDEPPKTTLEVVKGHYDEAHWNRLLWYFLDPSNPHGFETAVLSAVLDQLERILDDLHFDRYSVQDIQVEREIGTPNNNRADLVIRYDTEWFVWIEIKVRSNEGDRQTHRYVDDDYVGSMQKSEFGEENQFYVYIAPEGNRPTASEFVNLDWMTLVQALRPIQQEGIKEYPLRSFAQFVDFLDTIENETSMTQHEENQREMVELAIEYYDSIQDVVGAFEDVLTTYQEEWPQRFESYAPGGWRDEWHYHTGGIKQTFYKVDWPVADIPPGEDVSSSDPLRPYFQHVMSPDWIASNKLRFKTQLTGSDDQLRKEFQNYIYSEDVQERLRNMATDIEARAGCEIELPGRDDRTYTRFTKATYPFEWHGGEGYYQALATALEDHSEVITIYEEALTRLSD